MAVFLLLLKIAGILAVILLLLLILFVLELLFFPFRYEINASKEEVLTGRINLSWKARIVTADAGIDEKQSISGMLRFFGFPLFSFRKENDGNQLETNETADPVPEEEEKESQKFSFERLKRLFSLLKENEGRLVLSGLPGILRRLLSAVLPRKGSGYFCIGTGDMIETGQVFEALSVFYPLYGKVITLCPDFDRRVFNGKLEVSGRVFLCSVLFPLLPFLFRKEYRVFLARLKECFNG